LALILGALLLAEAIRRVDALVFATKTSAGLKKSPRDYSSRGFHHLLCSILRRDTGHGGHRTFSLQLRYADKRGLMPRGQLLPREMSCFWSPDLR
jgi:hypothetical protein